jgi:hypothetical protein
MILLASAVTVRPRCSILPPIPMIVVGLGVKADEAIRPRGRGDQGQPRIRRLYTMLDQPPVHLGDALPGRDECAKALVYPSDLQKRMITYL